MRLTMPLAIALSLSAPAAAQTPAPRPNIVLIAIDTVRADHLGCFGYDRPTSPNIDRFAARATLFENTYSPASWTVPAFMSVFTGHEPAVHGCTDSQTVLSPALSTIPQQLTEIGYHCAAVVSNPFLSAKYGFGRGFAVYDDYSVFLDSELSFLAVGGDEQPRGAVSETVTGHTVTQQARLIIDNAASSGSPFFVFVHYFDPHDSYVPPAPFDARFDPDYTGPVDGTGVPDMRYSPPPPRDLEHLIARHDGEIAYEDQQIGSLIEHIDAVSDPDNTIIILFSDHGEAFAEHGMLLHGTSAYREELWVPLIVRYPARFEPGRRVSNTTSLLDIAPTLYEILGSERPPDLPGHSLVAAASPQATSPGNPVFAAKANTSIPGRHIAVTQGRIRVHARFQSLPTEPTAEFSAFDLETDPREQRDLYSPDDPRFSDARDALIDRWNAQQSMRARLLAGRSQTPEVELTDEERRRLEGLGYTQPGAAN